MACLFWPHDSLAIHFEAASGFACIRFQFIIFSSLFCRRQVEAEERAELLERRSAQGPDGLPASWQRHGTDAEAAMMGHVSNSKRVLEEAYQTGTAILGNMSSQRDRLKVLAM